MIKAALIYTSTTPELIGLVEREVRNSVGEEIELLSYSDASVLAETRDSGFVTGLAAARLIGLYMEAVKDEADVILNCCSSVGEVADAAVDLGKYIGVPIVRIDEKMCREAVRLGKRIGVMATLPTTLEPTKKTIYRCAREMGRQVTLIDAVVEGAFGLSQAAFKERMVSKAGEIAEKVDVILFAQGSMAYCEQIIHEVYQKPVVSSPRFGAEAVRSALKDKGLIK